MGLNLAAVAFKGMHDYQSENLAYEEARESNRVFRKAKSKIAVYNLITKLKLRPYGLLSVIIFKEQIETEAKNRLAANGYDVILLPKEGFRGQVNSGQSE